MKHVARRTVTGLALLGTLGIGPALGTAPASAATASYTCTIDKWGTVTADWLRVHTSYSASSPSVGQIPRGNIFHFCSSSGTWNGGYHWVYGYGYNGSTKLTGWVDSEYLQVGSGV